MTQAFVLLVLLSFASCSGCKDRDQQLPTPPPRQTEGAYATAVSEKARALAYQVRAETAELEIEHAPRWIAIGDDLFRRNLYVQAANEYCRAADAYRRVYERWERTSSSDEYFRAIADWADARALRKQLTVTHIMMDQAASGKKPNSVVARTLKRLRSEVMESPALAAMDKKLEAAALATRERRFDDARPILKKIRRELKALHKQVQTIEAEERDRKE